MAEEANVTLSDPTTSAPETEHLQQDSHPKAADTAMDEGSPEPYKEGAEQEEAADGTMNAKQPNTELRLMQFSSC